MQIHKIATTLIVLLFVSSGFAQKQSTEIGIIGGVSYYTGDINHNRLFYAPKPAYGIFYRGKIDDHNNYRVQISRQDIAGNDADFPSEYQQTRARSFQNTIYELGLQYEFNFFPYNLSNRQHATTYFTTGASVVLITMPDQYFSAAFPVGFGVKYGIGKRLTIGAEWTYKFAFTDDLDLLPPNTQDPNLTPAENKQINNPSDKDWYSLAGIIISYNFASTKKWCPAYDRLK